MILLVEKCSACGSCIPYCPVGAILKKDKCVQIIEDECVECGACLRAQVCPADALAETELSWPRSLRASFSNPFVPHHTSTKQMGRGTEEIKTNDLTNIVRQGELLLLIEAGRPGIGASFKDVEMLTMTLASNGAKFLPETPVSYLIDDPQTGKLVEGIHGEKVLSAIIECKIDESLFDKIISCLNKLHLEIKNTVVSVSIAYRDEPEKTLSAQNSVLFSSYYCNWGKVNLGLGRPSKKEL